MNKYLAYTPFMLAVGFFNNVKAQNYDKQIDALQNELLKMKQEMNNGSDKSKAYFKKGKGLSIKSNDGKYSFQIKGRLMYDIAAIVDAEKTVNGVSSDYSSSASNDTEGFGSEFRRIRFTQSK